MAAQKAFKTFLTSNTDSVTPWQEFLDGPIVTSELEVQEQLTPLYGTDDYALLSDDARRSLYLGFVRIIGESIAFFESLLCSAWFLHRQKSDRERDLALKKFSREELYHSKAFRRFLNQRKELKMKPKQKKASMLYGQRSIRRLMFWIVKKCPLAIMIHGAKAETFTLYYSRKVMHHLDASSDWYRINKLHYLDEIHHVPIGYEVYDAYLEEVGFTGRIVTLGLSLLFTMLIQVMLFRSVLGLTTTIFRQRFRYAWRITHWILFDFSPFVDTRKHLLSHYKKRKFRHYRIMKLIHCGVRNVSH